MKFPCFSPLPHALAPAGSQPLLRSAGLPEEQTKECSLAGLLETVATARLLVLSSPAVLFVTKSYRLTTNALRKLSQADLQKVSHIGLLPCLAHT